MLSSSPGAGVSYLQNLVKDQNTASDCAGPIENIPFIVCTVGQLGLTSFGTFNQSINGSNFVAIVSDLGGTGGYNIEAIVTKDSKEVFRYKANTDGTKGEVFALFHELVHFPVEHTYEKGAKITWDGTSPADSTVEYTTEAFENQYGDASYYDHLVAVIDQDKNLADIIAHTYLFNGSGPRAGAGVLQTRVQGNNVVEIQFECENTTPPVKGTDCFNRDWTIVDHASIPPGNAGTLVGGTVDYTNYYMFTFKEGIYLTGSDGSFAIPGGSFTDAGLKGLLTAGRGSNSEAFQVVADKAGNASGTGLEKAIYAIKAKTFNDLNSILSTR